MKIIYKVNISYDEDKKFTGCYFFDTYEHVKDWLDKYFEKSNKTNKLTNLSIETLMLCSNCGEYDNPNCYSFIKEEYNNIMSYCINCSPNYKVDISSFLAKEEDNND